LEDEDERLLSTVMRGHRTKFLLDSAAASKLSLAKEQKVSRQRGGPRDDA